MPPKHIIKKIGKKEKQRTIGKEPDPENPDKEIAFDRIVDINLLPVFSNGFDGDSIASLFFRGLTNEWEIEYYEA